MSHPVYVRIVQPIEIDDLISSLRIKINDVRNRLDKIETLSKEESDKVSEWKTNLENANVKIDTLNNMLTE